MANTAVFYTAYICCTFNIKITKHFQKTVFKTVIQNRCFQNFKKKWNGRWKCIYRQLVCLVFYDCVIYLKKTFAQRITWEIPY